MANASLEDCQLFAQSEILQRDLFIAAKDQEDHPKKREDCVQHEAESVSASSLKINRFRNRWNSGEAHRCVWSLLCVLLSKTILTSPVGQLPLRLATCIPSGVLANMAVCRFQVGTGKRVSRSLRPNLPGGKRRGPP